jgi:hypothetical protein
MEQPLMFGAFACGRERKTGVPNIDLIWGWNFIVNEHAHAGVYLYTLIPTGTTPKAETIFEPIIGNGRLWELGPGVTGHYDLVRRGDHILSLYWEAVLAHQFKRIQVRSFDLENQGPFSRYMLLKEFDAKGNYDHTLINAIDFCTRATRVGGSVRFDGAVKLSYYYDRWGVDFGYNLYAKSPEKLRIVETLFPSEFNNRRLGIKGVQGVCDNLTATQSTAFTAGPADNPSPVIIDEITVRDLNGKTKTEFRPVADILNIKSGSLPHQLTHKFFFNIGYTALDTCWEPQWGLGFEYEIDGRKKLLNGLEQWGFWFKGTFSF